MNTETRPAACVLVENGLHAGARLELREAAVWYAVGGQVDAEYWLADADLAEGKLEFALIDGTVRARLLAGPPMIFGSESVEAGAEAVAFDRPMLWGGVSLRAVVLPPPLAHDDATTAPPPANAKALAGKMKRVARALVSDRRLLSVVLALAVLLIPAVAMSSLLASMLQRQHAQELQREALSAQEDPRAQYLRARQAAERLSDLIGLQAVSVSAVDGKTLAVFGTSVPAAERDRVRAAIAQFERDFTVRDNVIYQTEPAAGAVLLTRLPEGIDLVQYGPHGYLRGHDGRLYLPGGLLPDGMRVDLIRDHEVRFSRGNERAVLRAGDAID